MTFVALLFYLHLSKAYEVIHIQFWLHCRYIIFGRCLVTVHRVDEVLVDLIGLVVIFKYFQSRRITKSGRGLHYLTFDFILLKWVFGAQNSSLLCRFTTEGIYY